MPRWLLPALLLATVSANADKKKDPDEIGSRNVASGINFYSIEREIALGRQLSQEIRKEARVVDDPIIAEYFNRIGQNLARNSDVIFPVSFTLIEGDEINAFTLPGGFVFMNTGALLLSDNEAELASVIAHELGHAAARHATRQVSRSQMVGIGTLPLIFMGGWAGLAARQLASLAAPMAFFQFSRAFEDEADLLGLQYLWKTGYDPNASVDMFERVESTERGHPGAVSRLFRTHPLTADRLEKTQKNIGQLLPERPEYVINTSEYEEVRARLKSILAQHKLESKDSGRPTLRRAGEDPPVNDSGTPEDRPTLKRPLQ